MSNPDVSGDSDAAADAFVGDDELPVPVFAAEQYLAELDDVGSRSELFRNEFGLVRAFFRERPNRYWRLQRRLNQARVGVPYDVYLSQSVKYASLAGILGALLGLLITFILGWADVFSSISSPVDVGGAMAGIAQFIATNRMVVAGATLMLGLSLLSLGAVWLARLYYPSIIVDNRRRSIDVNLPHTIVYMYALSFGGMEFLEVIRRTAEADDTYGDVADEFDMIVRDVDLFGADLHTALRNTRNLTPSDNLESFLDDLLSVLDSGGDVATFLRDESEKYMDRARTEQEQFLDTLELLSEMFVVLFVAAPLLVVVVLLLMSFLGENTIPHLMAMIYVVIPLVMLAFITVVSVLSEPYKQPDHDLKSPGRDPDLSPDPELQRVPGFSQFRAAQYRRRIRSFLSSPFASFVRHPTWTLVFTVPAAVAAVAVIRTVTDIPLSTGALLSQPFSAALAYVIVPFLTVAVPLSGFHEYERRRRESIASRLPDALDILASANQMGVSLNRGIELVTRNLSGTFAEQLRRTHNDIEWNHDIQDALRSLANRVNVPQLTRTCNILAEGARSTGDLHRVLNIAAEDTRHRFRLDRDRQQELNTYVAIVIVGFLVYLGVVVILDRSFLGPVAEQAASTDTSSVGLISINAESLDLYHALFLHSALIQGVGTGMIAGKLNDNSVLTGLKYGIALVVLSMVVFFFI